MGKSKTQQLEEAERTELLLISASNDINLRLQHARREIDRLLEEVNAEKEFKPALGAKILQFLNTHAGVDDSSEAFSELMSLLGAVAAANDMRDAIVLAYRSSRGHSLIMSELMTHAEEYTRAIAKAKL